MKTNEVIRDLRKILTEIRTEYDIQEIGIFGSYVRNEQTENSDIDILLIPGDSMDLWEFTGLRLDLSEKLGVEVDLVDKTTLKKRIGQEILKEVIYI